MFSDNRLLKSFGFRWYKRHVEANFSLALKIIKLTILGQNKIENLVKLA
jgi:hypothetical protein